MSVTHFSLSLVKFRSYQMPQEPFQARRLAAPSFDEPPQTHPVEAKTASRLTDGVLTSETLLCHKQLLLPLPWARQRSVLWPEGQSIRLKLAEWRCALPQVWRASCQFVWVSHPHPSVSDGHFRSFSVQLELNNLQQIQNFTQGF